MKQPHRTALFVKWHARDVFPQTGRHSDRLLCPNCQQPTGLRVCIGCGVTKAVDQFSSTRWDQILARRLCLACSGDMRCSTCPLRGDASKFSPEEWRKPDGDRRCKDCVPARCAACHAEKVKSAYHRLQWKLGDGERVCADCERKRCGQCSKLKLRKDFDLRVWDLVDGSPNFACRACTTQRKGMGNRGMWTCRNKRCQKKYKPMEEFSLCRLKHGNAVKGNSKVCDECIRRREEEEAAMARKSAEQVTKTVKRPRTH